jgi:hypothetical protein
MLHWSVFRVMNLMRIGLNPNARCPAVLGVRYWHWLDSVLALALSYALEFGWTAEKLVAPNFIPWLGGYSRNESAASQRSSTFSVRSSSARVRPRLTAAIGMPRRAAIWTKRKPE